MSRLRVAEIGHETLERPLGRYVLSVVVAGDRDDWGSIVDVRVVKLGLVFASFAVEIDDVAEMIEELGPVARIRLAELLFEMKGDAFLRIGSVTGIAGIADRVKDHLA